ncbi:MAG TPA: hypothetical protein VK589_30460 [Chryseolinea sp.]|nr:hypothetical protein [Chryseolinea sp.]
MNARKTIPIWLTLTEKNGTFHLVSLMKTRANGIDIALLMEGTHNDLGGLFSAMLLRIQGQRESPLSNFFAISFDSMPTELQFLALRDVRQIGFKHYLFGIRVSSVPDPNHAQVLTDAQAEALTWRQLPPLHNFGFLNSARLN